MKDNLEQSRYIKLIKKEKANLPFFVNEYDLFMQHSLATEYQYLTEFRRFFTWLRENEISKAKNNSAITIQELNDLRNMDMMLYVDYLKHETNRHGKLNSSNSVNRSLNALRSLFTYLTVNSEDENGLPYMTHNVMLKIKQVKNSETLNARSRNIERQMYTGNKKHQLIDFIENSYIQGLNNKIAITLFKRNKERDIAIIAILLGSGGRRSEVANLDVEHLELREQMINFIRKGGALDTVPLAPWCIPYVKEYLKVRKKRYHATKNDHALFLTTARHEAKRISAGQINNIVKKYSSAFGRPSTAHKLRHTTASELFAITKNEMLVAQQLGQASTSATHLYTHINQDTQRLAMSKLK